MMHLPALRRLLIVCGPPRTGTTWIHNALIRSGAYRGVLAVDNEIKDAATGELFTDEEPISTRCAVAFHFASTPLRRWFEGQRLVRVVAKLLDAFGVEGRLMLESPYYCFGLRAFSRIAGDRLAVIFMRRNALSAASSMTTHVQLGRTLERTFDESCDLYHHAPGVHRPVEVAFADPTVLTFARCHYEELTPLARAMFKWHCFEQAFFQTSIGIAPERRFIFDYDAFASGRGLDEVARFAGLSANQAQEVWAGFRHSAREIDMERLGARGRELVKLLKARGATPTAQNFGHE